MQPLDDAGTVESSLRTDRSAEKNHIHEGVAVKASKWVALSAAALLAFGALALTGCGKSGGSSSTSDSGSKLSGSISISGSDTMVNMAQAWAEAFGEKNPGVLVSVKGGGSGNGIAALINKTVDFADASREMKPEEIDQAKAAGVDAVATEVARDGIAVIANSANGVKGLTKDQLGKVYRGEITNWKDLGGADAPIVLLGRDTSSGTYAYFQEAVVGKDKNYAKEMRNLQSSQAIVDEVSKNANAIGYVGLGYENTSIKVLEVDGKAATVDSVLDGSYVLSRPLLMISNGQPTGTFKAYLDWILSADGQKVVSDQGFVPVK